MQVFCMQKFYRSPNPLSQEGFRPLPKPLANLWQGDVIDFGDWSPTSKFWYGSQSLCPFGASHGFLYNKRDLFGVSFIYLM